MPDIRRTAQAEEDLIDLWLYIAQDNPGAADRLLDEIEDKCSLLAANPQLGPARPDIAADCRSFPVGSLHHPAHLDAVRNEAVQDEIAAHGKRAAVRGDVWTCRSKLRVGSQQGAFVLDLIQQAIGRAGIVLSDIQPEID